MRPTVIRLIAGGALGVAFSVSLTLPGSVVFPDEAPIRQLAAPEAPAATVLHAAPVVRPPGKAPSKPRVVVQRVYVPTAGTVRTTSVVRRTPPRSKPRKPVKRTPAPVAQPVTPLAARPAPPAAEPSDEPKQTDEQGDDEEAERPRKSKKPKKADEPRKLEKPKRAKKPNDHGSRKHDKSGDAGNDDRDDQGEDRRGHDKGKHGGGRGNHG
jgi:type IV secretory pathway VirB10-like protein